MKRVFLLWLLAFAAAGQVWAQGPATAPRLSAADHQQSVQLFQQELNKEFLNPEESPLTAAERQAFASLPYYPVSYAHYVEATLVRDSTSQPFAMETSTARRPLYRKYGELRFTLQGTSLKLSVYQSADLLKRPGFENYLFAPFTDLTNGHGSYGGGRYIDLRIPPTGTRVMQLDFNRAYNPSCAYDRGYSCPVPPAENRLPVAITAGVQASH